MFLQYTCRPRTFVHEVIIVRTKHASVESASEIGSFSADSNLFKNKHNHNLTLRMKEDHSNINLGTLPFCNINDFRLQQYTHRTDVFRDMQKFQVYSEFFHAQK